MTHTKTYSELLYLPTFTERFLYLKLDGTVGEKTFGWQRYANQEFYRSKEWKSLRDRIILRDNGCELGIEDFPIAGKIYIHHMNPIDVNDIENTTDYLINPEYLICCSFKVHQAIHYGDESILDAMTYKVRTKNDTCPWKGG